MTDTFLRLYVYGLTGVVVAWALYIASLVVRATWRRLVRSQTPLQAVPASEGPGAPLRAQHRQHVDA